MLGYFELIAPRLISICDLEIAFSKLRDFLGRNKCLLVLEEASCFGSQASEISFKLVGDTLKN